MGSFLNISDGTHNRPRSPELRTDAHYISAEAARNQATNLLNQVRNYEKTHVGYGKTYLDAYLQRLEEGGTNNGILSVFNRMGLTSKKLNSVNGDFNEWGKQVQGNIQQITSGKYFNNTHFVEDSATAARLSKSASGSSNIKRVIKDVPGRGTLFDRDLYIQLNPDDRRVVDMEMNKLKKNGELSQDMQDSWQIGRSVRDQGMNYNEAHRQNTVFKGNNHGIDDSGNKVNLPRRKLDVPERYKRDKNGNKLPDTKVDPKSALSEGINLAERNLDRSGVTIGYDENSVNETESGFLTSLIGAAGNSYVKSVGVRRNGMNLDTSNGTHNGLINSSNQFANVQGTHNYSQGNSYDVTATNSEGGIDNLLGDFSLRKGKVYMKTSRGKVVAIGTEQGFMSKLLKGRSSQDSELIKEQLKPAFTYLKEKGNERALDKFLNLKGQPDNGIR